MRIAQIATLGTRVKETGSGSIESLVWLLSRELTDMGHDVTVFAAAGSEGPFELVPTLPGTYGATGVPDDWHLCEWINICRAVEQSERFDVIHSHNYLWGIPLQSLACAPMVHTTHVMPSDDDARLISIYQDVCVTGISQYQWNRYPEQPSAVVYHGIDRRQFTFRREPDDYLCFLGRFMGGKGPKIAIETAQALGLRLLLAGPKNEYYDRHIAPLVDGTMVEYVGAVGGRKRDQLLGGASALLYPIQHPEPFGLVLAEAMVCGTPVAAIGLGAVPELVDEGITGCIADDNDSFADAVVNALSLDRKRVHEHATARFSSERMACAYAEIYQSLLVKEPCR